MENATSILERYWGFSSFRANQEPIIRSVIEGRDTLALLPTGGGKSICYQVPGMMLDGICLVISPLIALMKDQVENLRERKIKAELVVSGMDFREIDRILDNCAYGDIKFLYVSPERLSTQMFKDRVAKMKVNLIAVDEAHCISQWGYDFRPAYLEIAEIRKLLPGCPMLALTATATPAVVKDIQKRLGYQSEHVIQSSFERTNVAYIVRRAEDKHGQLLKICQNVKGSGIVYANTRKRTVELANFLKGQGISADYYHAGVKSDQKDEKQDRWKHNHFRVMVATNAFGMGIDKPDVRFVVHMNIPSSPEAFFQEAGRAGRDGRKSFAVLVYNDVDVKELEASLDMRYPDLASVKKVYKALWNASQIAVGAGEGVVVDHDHSSFCRAHDLDIRSAHFAMLLLERAGYLSVGESAFHKAKVQVLLDKAGLYNFQVQNPRLEPLLKTLLRSYSGLFSGLTTIDEVHLSKHLQVPPGKVLQLMKSLDDHGIVSFVPGSQKPRLTFLVDRPVNDDPVLPHEIYRDRKKTDQIRMKGMTKFIASKDCRSMYLLRYFGEDVEHTCGVCDVCVENRRRENSPKLDQLDALITEQLQKEPLNLDQLQSRIRNFSEEDIRQNVRWRIDQGQLEVDDGKRIHLVEN